MLVEVPSELIGVSDYSEQDLKIDVAILLYKRQVMTLARAARWVGMTRLEFQKALAERGFPINFSIEDFETDLKTLHSMAG
jgi:predicted HTH domain antitoxin